MSVSIPITSSLCAFSRTHPKLKAVVDIRKRVVQERRNIEYKYMLNMRDHEEHTGEIILNGFFIDKTEMYQQLLELQYKHIWGRSERFKIFNCLSLVMSWRYEHSVPCWGDWLG